MKNKINIQEKLSSLYARRKVFDLTASHWSIDTKKDKIAITSTRKMPQRKNHKSMSGEELLNKAMKA